MNRQADEWQGALQSFFDERGRAVSRSPGFEELCFVSGRDTRLWRDRTLYADLIDSIVDVLGVDAESHVVEVGCAAGFLAYGVAPRVGHYEGVDLAANALAAARSIDLPNADFHQSDARALPFSDGSVDAAFCYDVVTNFPAFADFESLILEMLRVVKPGGRILIGSVPDRACQAEYEAKVHAFAADLERRFGPAVAGPSAPSITWLDRVLRRLRLRPSLPPPSISCYYFDRADFEALASRQRCALSLTDIHALNPYRGYRFNAIFQRPT